MRRRNIAACIGSKKPQWYHYSEQTHRGERVIIKRILISGASVAGPALAFWLQRYGFDVTIVERAPAVRPGGYAVDFRGTATQVLERMELTGAVKQHETRAGTITMVDEHGKTLAKLPDGFTSGDIEILRGDLVKVLYEATRNGVRYIFNDSIRTLTQTPGDVEVTYGSGTTDSFDLVVGADGLHSNTRALAFGEEVRFVHNMGYYLAIFTVPDYLHLKDQGRYYTQLGKRVGLFGSESDGQAKASFYFASSHLGRQQAEDLTLRDVPTQKHLLREVFSDMKWETQRLLSYLDDAPDLYFDALSQVRMERWSEGRVVLLGDASACASPVAGMGTSIAILGAYTLAGELKQADTNYALAFARYEAALRPMVKEAQKMAESVGWFVPQSRLKLWFSRRMWSWMSESTLKKLMIDQPNTVASLVPLKEYA